MLDTPLTRVVIHEVDRLVRVNYARTSLHKPGYLTRNKIRISVLVQPSTEEVSFLGLGDRGTVGAFFFLTGPPSQDFDRNYFIDLL